MKPAFRLPGLLCLCAGLACGQLTTEQKEIEFRQLSGLYAKQYAPWAWKRDTQGFDLYQTGPWLQRVLATRSDLEFYDVLSEYVAGLNDAHDVFLTPSNFAATLGFHVDLYEGRPLIDSIVRQRLPLAQYPFQVGDELVSMDGVPALEMVRRLERYAIAANPRSTRRFAAGYIASRFQSVLPQAPLLGDTATIVVRREDGTEETYTLPWLKTGLPFTTIGLVPTLLKRPDTARRTFDAGDYRQMLLDLQHIELPAERAVLGVGSLAPAFRLPTGFRLRLGVRATDPFLSGTYEANGFRIGFIRIPSYGPADPFGAIDIFQDEIAYMQANTDGLVIDQMRNPGGYVFYVNELVRFIIPYLFRNIGFEIRATSTQVQQFSNLLESARTQGAPDYVIVHLTALLRDVVTANSENRGHTGPLPLDAWTLDNEPPTDADGNLLAYTKPVIVLADEISASGGDAFPATFQDAGRGKVVGMRTMGAGGSVVGTTVGSYSEAVTYITQSLMVRKEPRAVPGYPVTAYVENVGVHPDVELDYMTRENLLTGGRPFVDAFTNVIVEEIRKARP